MVIEHGSFFCWPCCWLSWPLGLAIAERCKGQSYDTSVSKKDKYLAGITCSGTPNIGKCVGTLQPALSAAKDESADCFFFLTDYPGLIATRGVAVAKAST